MTMSTKKTDDRLDPNAKAVGQPLACQLDIVPIFPVRFSMSSKTLNNAAKTGSAPPMPCAPHVRFQRYIHPLF